MYLLFFYNYVNSQFCPSTWNDLPLPFRQKPSLDSYKSNLKAFLQLKTCLFFVPRYTVFIRLLKDFVCCPLKMCANDALYNQYTSVCGCLCACVRVCALTKIASTKKDFALYKYFNCYCQYYLLTKQEENLSDSRELYVYIKGDNQSAPMKGKNSSCTRE